MLSFYLVRGILFCFGVVSRDFLICWLEMESVFLAWLLSLLRVGTKAVPATFPVELVL